MGEGESSILLFLRSPSNGVEYEHCFVVIDDPKTFSALASPEAVGREKGRRERAKHLFNTSKESQRYLHEVTLFRRIPEFYPYRRREFHLLNYFANTTTIFHFQFPFPPHQQIRFDSRFKMTAMYSFRNETAMLNYVMESLHPASAIRKVTKAIVAMLPKPIIAIHMRVDDEAFQQLKEGDRSIRNDEEAVDRMVRYIQAHPCLQSYLNQTAGNAAAGQVMPSLYLSVNGLPALYPRIEKRKQRLIRRLLSQSFHKGLFNYDRISHSLSKSLSSPGKRETEIDNKTRRAEETRELEKQEILSLMNEFSPEQLSYVDLMVSRASHCFIPSYVPSLHSYLIKRLRNLDNGVRESYEEINQETYGSMYFYRDWGF